MIRSPNNQLFAIGPSSFVTSSFFFFFIFLFFFFFFFLFFFVFLFGRDRPSSLIFGPNSFFSSAVNSQRVRYLLEEDVFACGVEGALPLLSKVVLSSSLVVNQSGSVCCWRYFFFGASGFFFGVAGTFFGAAGDSKSSALNCGGKLNLENQYPGTKSVWYGFGKSTFGIFAILNNSGAS